jgi:hypothetical protein
MSAPVCHCAETVHDPIIGNSTDAHILITSSCVCRSELHLYDGHMPATGGTRGNGRARPTPALAGPAVAVNQRLPLSDGRSVTPATSPVAGCAC